MALEAQCKPDKSLPSLEGIYIFFVLLTIKKQGVKMKNFFLKNLSSGNIKEIKHEDIKNINVFYIARHSKIFFQR